MKALFVLFLLSACSLLPAQQEPKYTVEYYCPPCGCAEDERQFTAPGVCQTCNMTLHSRVAGLEDKPRRTAPRRSVAVLLFDGADIMDVTGPMSVFEHAWFNILTVAKDDQPKRIGRHLVLQPDHTFATLPPVDVIVLPGGGPAESEQDPEIVAWIKERYANTETLFSVCSGAFFLGKAGLLDGREATTFAALIPDLQTQFPEARVLNNVKYTNSERIITSSGLSSGIDASFEVVAKYLGAGTAQDVANHMEYPWMKQHDYARSQLADNYIRGINRLVRNFAMRYTYSAGDQQRWTYHFVLWEGVDIPEMMRFLADQLERTGKWTPDKTSEDFLSGGYEHEVLGPGRIKFGLKPSETDRMLLIVEAERITTAPTQPEN